MSSVLLSVAPQIELMMMKMSCRELSFPVAAFQQAVSYRPDIINCSWGTIHHEPQLHLEVMNAIDLGIQVVFAAGNGSTDRKSAMFQSIAVPESVTVGGVFIDEQFSPSSLSDISSSFISEVYTGRSVPDVCGPCGMLPDAQLILFPTEPGSDFDKRNGETDGTGKEDGWLVSSGTSAAAAWVSGHTAILMQLKPQDSNKNYKEVLRRFCQPVRRGVSAMGLEVSSNVQGSDLASGAGFVRFAKELMNDFNGNSAL
jgi:subtilisin family serine protease